VRIEDYADAVRGHPRVAACSIRLPPKLKAPRAQSNLPLINGKPLHTLKDPRERSNVGATSFDRRRVCQGCTVGLNPYKRRDLSGTYINHD
jgi:hypothetical protein